MTVRWLLCLSLVVQAYATCGKNPVRKTFDVQPDFTVNCSPYSNPSSVTLLSQEIVSKSHVRVAARLSGMSVFGGWPGNRTSIQGGYYTITLSFTIVGGFTLKPNWQPPPVSITLAGGTTHSFGEILTAAILSEPNHPAQLQLTATLTPVLPDPRHQVCGYQSARLYRYGGGAPKIEVMFQDLECQDQMIVTSYSLYNSPGPGGIYPIYYWTNATETMALKKELTLDGAHGVVAWSMAWGLVLKPSGAADIGSVSSQHCVVSKALKPHKKGTPGVPEYSRCVTSFPNKVPQSYGGKDTYAFSAGVVGWGTAPPAGKYTWSLNLASSVDYPIITGGGVWDKNTTSWSRNQTDTMLIIFPNMDPPGEPGDP